MPAKLVIMEGRDKGREIRISKKTFLIGRAQENDLILVDDMSSRMHAEIVISDDGRYTVKDARSKNGLFVNGCRVIEHELTDGDIVQVGKNKLLFKSEQDSLGIKSDSLQQTPAPGNSYQTPQAFLSSSQSRPKSFYESLAEDGPTNVAFKVPDSEIALHVERINKMVKALYQASHVVSGSKDRDSILKAIINITVGSFNLDRAGIFIADKGTGVFKLAFYYSQDSSPIKSQDLDLRVIADKFNHKYFSFISSSDEIAIVKDRDLSMLVAALRSHQDLLGFIYIESAKDNYIYSDSDLETLTSLASITSTGIVKATLLRENAEMQAKLVTLEKQISPEVARAISEKNSQLLENPFIAEEREVTVLFSDIEDFTPLSERLPPSELASLLNEYFSRMVEIVVANKGTVNKFIGDAVMAIFGAPQSHGNDAAGAVRAAVGMIKELKQFHSQVDKNKRFNIRIGINTGKAVAGLIGSDRKMEYTVLGDTVNCASRIESLAPANRVAVGELTYEKVKDEFQFESLGETLVKGKSKTIKVYLVADL
jgi:adenylate cyclase